MTLDLVTMRIVFAILTATMLVLFYLDTYRRTSAPYCAWWCGAVAAFLVNAVLQMVASGTDQQWARHIGNAVLVLGAAFVWSGARSLTGRPARWWQFAPIPVFAALAAMLGTNDSVNPAGSVIVTALVGLGIGFGAIEMRRLWSSNLAQSRPLALASAACAVYFLARAAFVAALDPNAPVFPAVHSFLTGLFGPNVPTISAIFGPGIGTLLSLLLLIVVTSSMASLSSEQNAQALRAKAAHDGLTGLFTRAEFYKQAQRRLQAASAERTQATLVMADLDHFKSINDTLGHAAGDQVIRAFADACRGSVRSTDLVGRYGGEEFMLLLSGVDPEGAARITAGINYELAASPAVAALDIRPTASFGIVGTGAGKESVDALARYADKALYTAKAEGRNRSVIAAR